jgi:hypothetical protein
MVFSVAWKVRLGTQLAPSSTTSFTTSYTLGKHPVIAYR